MNQTMLDLLGGDESKYPKYLEANFPHIFAKLVEYWPTAGIGAYLDDLMLSKRTGRRGFPDEAVAEIWALSKYYEQSRPKTEVEPVITDVWQLNIENDF